MGTRTDGLVRRMTGFGWVRVGAAAWLCLGGAAGVVGAWGMAGCGGTPARSSAPLVDARDPGLGIEARVEALAAAWDAAAADAGSSTAAGVSTTADWASVRATSKDLAWSGSTPKPLRTLAVQRLMGDTSEAGRADSRALANLMIPVERDIEVVSLLSVAAAANGWTDLTPALVRRYADEHPTVRDADRPEAAALARLHPGRSLNDVAFEVFLRPGPVETASDRRAAARGRVDAWALLTRLDADGSYRAGALARADVSGLDAESRSMVEALRAAQRDFGVTPAGALELEWLRRLASPEDAANRAWWQEASAAVARLTAEQRRGLALRHVEAVRWSAAHAPARVAAERSTLLAELAQALRGRERHRRTAEGTVASRERLEDWADRMTWGDLLAMLTLDEALASGPVAARLWQISELDRRDTTTEYGGTLDAAGTAGAFAATLYLPRARDRGSDVGFVASDDMLRGSDRSLAHFHMQVQRPFNGSYAGPSGGDLDYAYRSGRLCFVVTSVDHDLLNIDAYMPDGVTLDLGEFRRPQRSSAR